MTYRSLIRPANEAALDPQAVPSLVIDLDFGRADRLFSNLAGTTPSTAGGEIACAVDAKSGLRFLKGTTGPVWSASSNGYADFGDASTYKALSVAFASSSPWRNILEARSPRALTVLAVSMLTDLNFQTSPQTIAQYRSDTPTSSETWKISGEYPNPNQFRARTYRDVAVAAVSNAYATFMPANQWVLTGFTFQPKDSFGATTLALWVDGHRLHSTKYSVDMIQDPGSVFTLYVGANNSGNRLKGGIRRLMVFEGYIEADLQRRLRKYILGQMGILS